MGISKKELQGLIEVQTNIEKISKLSFDGKNLLTRIPKDIEEFFSLKKGNKIIWNTQDKDKIILTMER